MIQPYDYYETNDSIAVTLSDVKRNIELIQEFAARHEYRVFWRGQMNHEWGLISSLVRRLAAASAVDDALLDRVEWALLTEAAAWITDLDQDSYAYSLAKLAYLQHHGVPSRLLDFTADPWMAVFFAAESMDDLDGRIFALLVRPDDILETTPKGRPWRKYKTNEVKVYDPETAGLSFARVAAQKGVLVVGRLPSTQPHRTAIDRLLKTERSLLADEVRRILSIPFKLSKFDPNLGQGGVPAGARSPIGLTFRLHVDKRSVRRDLAGVTAGKRISPPGASVMHRSVYPDAAGMVEHSEIIRGLDRGVLVMKSAKPRGRKREL